MVKLLLDTRPQIQEVRQFEDIPPMAGVGLASTLSARDCLSPLVDTEGLAQTHPASIGPAHGELDPTQSAGTTHLKPGDLQLSGEVVPVRVLDGKTSHEFMLHANIIVVSEFFSAK